ncbi:universal stress protein [Thermodesulfovibrio sp. 3907-1M]|uniref:Universal stress protein n=1 Tax=Thermodesulfovibrio autotrophicus TaxID=3118333 RepID=A0AAU8GXH7_9BACT
MYKKVLVEIDEGITASVSARYALKFAKLNNASLYLCFIHKKDAKFEKAETILKRVFIEAEKNNLKAECIIKEGERFAQLKDIIKKEKIDIAFLLSDDFKRLSKLPCSVAVVKIINMGKITPKRILFILRGRLDYLKEKTDFIMNISKIFHVKVFIIYFGKDKNIEKIFSSLRKHDIKIESKVLPKFSYKLGMFQSLSKKVELLVVEQKRAGFLGIFKPDSVSKLIENPPCNLIVFKPYHKK